MKLMENATVEYKREYINDINKAIIAFANTSGGTLYIGIENDGSVVGVTDSDAIQLQASNSIRDTIKPDITMFVEYQTEIIDGKSVIKIVVQKGTMSPYYIASKGMRPSGVFVRQGASTIPASETAIVRMIKDTDGEKFEDVRSLNQDLTFEAAEKEFAQHDVPFGLAQQKTMGLINADGLYTNLALLLSDQCVHMIKLAVFDGTEKAKFRDRREFTGSLLKQLNDVYEFIDRYNSVRSEIVGLYRKDKRDYPEEAVREALLNALVHRDYSFSDGTLISIFDDRIELVSIGGLVTGMSFDDMMLGISVTRNTKLANVFYRLTLIEAFGTGVPNIVRSYNEQLIKPQIEVTDNAFKVTLPNVNAEDEFTGYTENEKMVLILLKNHPLVTRKEIEDSLSISQALAGRILKGLVDKGEIKTLGKGKSTKYSRK